MVICCMEWRELIELAGADYAECSTNRLIPGIVWDIGQSLKEPHWRKREILPQYVVVHAVVVTQSPGLGHDAVVRIATM